MRLYVETSALVAFVFGEPPAPLVVQELRAAELLTASKLTLLEAGRVIVRGEALGEFGSARASEMRAQLAKVSASWSIVELDDEVLERARRPFPQEPIRTLDAIHLASALAIRETVGPLSILSLDTRVRRSAFELGFPLVPAMGDSIHEPR